MSMEIKDFGMTGAELTTVTKNLMKSIMLNLDWPKVEETFFSMTDWLTDEQRGACWRMFTETEESFADFSKEIDDWAESLNLVDAFNEILEEPDEVTEPESDEENEPQLVEE